MDITVKDPWAQMLIYGELDRIPRDDKAPEEWVGKEISIRMGELDDQVEEAVMAGDPPFDTYGPPVTHLKQHHEHGGPTSSSFLAMCATSDARTDFLQTRSRPGRIIGTAILVDQDWHIDHATQTPIRLEHIEGEQRILFAGETAYATSERVEFSDSRVIYPDPETLVVLK